jgi:hypothetical protein
MTKIKMEKLRVLFEEMVGGEANYVYLQRLFCFSLTMMYNFSHKKLEVAKSELYNMIFK